MATLQGKAVKNTYRQVLQIGANNVGVSGTLQPVQDGAGNNTALSLSTLAATVNGDLTITGDLIITGGGIQIQDLIDDTVATLIQNGTGITWAYNDTARTLTPTITIATADGGVQGDYLQLNTNANEASAVGKLKWNTTDGTMDIGLMGGNVVLQVGQEQVARVLNNSGTILTEAGYQAVKIASAQGQRLAVNLAQANTEANSTDTLGLVTENIANNQEGFVTTSGLVREIDTTGDLQSEVWVDGDTLYLSPTIPGGVTKVKPLAPQQTVIVGFVVYAHKNHGKIFVKVDNGYELNELHNVRITSVANNDVLKYNSSLSVWENVAPVTTWITEGTNLYYTQARFDSAFAAKTTTNLAEGVNLYWTTARGNANFTTNLAASSTTNLAEGTNLYWTNQRFDSRFSTKTTTDLAEGTNLYYTQTRFNTAFDAKTTTDLDEGTNLYYTDARARAAISENAVGLDYSAGSGVLSLTAGYAIPTTVKLGQYDTAYNRSIVSAAVTGTSTKTLTLTEQDANTITATWTDQGITTINGTANQIAASTVGNTTTVGFTNDVTFPNNVVVSGNLTINGTATYVNTQSISSKDPLFEVANDNNTTDAVDIGYYGRYYDSAQTRVEFTGLFRDASDAGKYKIFSGLVDEPTNVVDTTGTGYTVGTLVANVEGNLAGTANAANVLSTARSISATGDAAWTVSFDGSADATAALTLANTGVTATTYGTSTSVPTIAVDGKGRITSASNTNIAFPVTTVNGASGTVVLTTSNIAEGTNQYFTTARAQAAISGTAPISVASGVVSISQAGGATNGYLSSTDWNTFNNKQNALTNPVTGTGGNGYVPRFTGTSTIASGTIQDDGTYIGIGVAPAAGAKVKITANGTDKGLSISHSADTTLELIKGSGPSIRFYKSAATAQDWSLSGEGTSFKLYNNTTSTTPFQISTTGAATFSSSVTAGAGSFTASSGWGLQGYSTNSASFNAANGSGYGLYINSGTSASSSTYTAQFVGNGSTQFYIRGDGNVGIGTTSPSDILDVYGSIRSTLSSDNTRYTRLVLDGVRSYGAQDMYISQTTNNSMLFLTNATERMRITSGGDLMVGTGTAAARLHVYTGDAGTVTSQAGTVAIFENGAHTRLQLQSPDTYSPQIYFSSPSYPNSGSIDQYCAASSVAYMGFNQGGVERMRISGGGRMTITGGTTNSSDYALVANNANGSSGNILLVRNDGLVSLPITAVTWTTGNAANTWINPTGGDLYRSTSSIKYKKNVQDYTKGLAEVMQLRPVSYEGKGNIDSGKIFAGLIAEEVHELGLTEFVQYAEDGTPDALSYQNMIALAFKAIQELKAEIDILKAK